MKSVFAIVSMIGLSAVIGALVIGTRTFDGTVVDKPYERGLSYDAEHHEKERSGWDAVIMNKELFTGTNEILLSVIDNNGRPVTDVEVEVTVSRPSSASYDRSYKAVPAERDRFRITALLPLYGYWDARVQVTDGSRSIAFERKLFAEQRKP